jgi:hypothetical protein
LKNLPWPGEKKQEQEGRSIDPPLFLVVFGNDGVGHQNPAVGLLPTCPKGTMVDKSDRS